MTRKWIVALMMTALCVAANVNASDFCLWTLADSESVIGRVGYGLSDDVEVGVESIWRTDSEKPGQIWGLFGVYKAPDAIVFDEIFQNDWVPELTATPYIGALVSVDISASGQDRTLAGPLAGLIIQDIVVLEYAYLNFSDSFGEFQGDTYKLRIGLHIEF